jgi:hypothetical protein
MLTSKEIKTMERELVASSAVVSIGYDLKTETLEVEFKSGGIYQYYNVPDQVYRTFMASDSKGTFLHVNIKNAYSCSRV